MSKTPTTTRNVELPPATAYEKRSREQIGLVVSTILARGRVTKEKRLAHRTAVSGARAKAIQLGFSNNNRLIGQVLGAAKVPHAAQDVLGTLSHEAHPGLAGAVGIFRKTIKQGVVAVPDATASFARSVNELTPDATDADRRLIVLTGLGQIGLGPELTGTLDGEGRHIITIKGTELALPLTPNPPESELVVWTSPYQALDRLW